MSPLIPLAAGVAAIVAGWLILRTYGPGYRVGRLLASTPEVSIGEALTLAAGPPRYVRVRGRIDSKTDFEDDAHRPLVFRRTRLQLRRGSGWSAFEDRRERVPFEVREGLDGIAVDDTMLDAGLVVVPRESVGRAADAADRVPPGTSPETPVRLLVQHVSSIEHAIVLGVPGLDRAGAPRLSAGLGRPLVLTTLEPAEAIRVLTGGGARRPLAAAICLAGGLALVTLGLALAFLGAVTQTALAASPRPSTGQGGDPRSSGQGPGLVGDPAFALLAVVAIGVGAMVATLIYVRLTARRGG